MMDYGKMQKFSDENLPFDWIKSIHWYRLVNIVWPADIDLGDYHLTCLIIIRKNENTMGGHR